MYSVSNRPVLDDKAVMVKDIAQRVTEAADRGNVVNQLLVHPRLFPS